MKHVNKKHSRQYSGAVPVADDCNMLDDDLPDTHNERDMTYLQLSEDNIEDDLAAKCYSAEAMKLILCLVSKSSVTFNCASEVLVLFESYMQSTLNNIQKKVSNISGLDKNPALSVVLDEINRSRLSLSALNSEYKIKKSITENPLFINPIEIVLGEREETHTQMGASINNITVTDKAYYVPILKIIKTLFCDEKFATQILNENISRKTADSSQYSNYCDSRKFKQHELFSDTIKISLRIQLFYDGMGTTNPLRGHATIHSVGVFYIIFENLRNKYSCNFF